jgi:hypothetical protein
MKVRKRRGGVVGLVAVVAVEVPRVDGGDSLFAAHVAVGRNRLPIDHQALLCRLPWRACSLRHRTLVVGQLVLRRLRGLRLRALWGLEVAMVVVPCLSLRSMRVVH